MSAADLTRWNRAGLRRLRYVEGNAAEYLERLRVELARRFTDWSALHAPADADALARQRRLLAQYKATPGDITWEIARSLARAVHVQAATLDAYANEGFIETATQWDLLRRLAEMVGYAPALASSASTPLVVLAKPGPPALLAAGFQVANSPAPGAATVVFETLADLPVDEALNGLRLARWNRSEDLFDPFAQPPDSAAAGWTAPTRPPLRAGDPALLLQAAPPASPALTPAIDAAARAVTLAAVDPDSGAVRLDSDPAAGKTAWRRGYTRLLAAPRRVWRPRLNGPGLVRLDRGNAFAAGDIAAWWSAATWHFGRVVAAEAAALRIDASAPPAGSELFLATPVSPVTDNRTTPPVIEFRVPHSLRAAAALAAGGAITVLATEGSANAFVEGSGASSGYLRLKSPPSPLPAALLVVTAAAASVARVQAGAQPVGVYRFDGAPVGLSTGDWLVAEGSGADGRLVRRPCRVGRIEIADAGFTLRLDDRYTSAESEPAAARELIAALERIEALVDQSTFAGLRLDELLAGELARRPIEVIQGIAMRPDPQRSIGRLLRERGITSVAELAALAPGVAIAGISATRLRQLRSQAQQLVELPRSLSGPPAWLSRRLPGLVALESTLLPAPEALSLTSLTGPFAAELHPLGWDTNPSPVPDRSRLTLAMASASAPAALKPGRVVVVEPDFGRSTESHQTQIQAVDFSGPNAVVTLAEPLPAGAGFTLGGCVLRGNVVVAGHGERKPERVLGSGNAAMLNQEFVLEQAGVSAVADSTMPAGVRADIQVQVDDQIWQPVASLADSRPADSHYTVRPTESGQLRIGFGDGQRGRRLPSGTNNIRVRLRVGAGSAGNLPRFGLTNAVTPDRCVAAIRQPLPAIGGNDLESLDSIRVNAPASLRTMERAVSLEDCAHLAASQSSVWQAKSFAAAGGGRRQAIEVVIVPANGAPLGDDLRAQVPPRFLADQAAFLQRHSPPGIVVRVSAFEPVLIDLAAVLAVRSAAYESALVAARVRAALATAFSLRRRKLGDALQLGEVYRIVEAVEGVEYSTVTIALTAAAAGHVPPAPLEVQTLAGGPVQAIVAGERQLVHLDLQRSNLVVTTEEYTL